LLSARNLSLGHKSEAANGSEVMISLVPATLVRRYRILS
jgi:hypothetical protein